MEAELWTPTVFDLPSGNPFAYDARAISVISGTKAFTTGINTRDKMRCVICGEKDRGILEYAHIIPMVEDETVRSPYFLLRILTSEIRVVGTLAQSRLHSPSCQVSSTRGSKRHPDVQERPWTL
jgi:hypothetical protein